MSETRLSATPRAAPSVGTDAKTLGRTMLIWLAVLVSLQVRPIGPALLMPTLLLVGLVLCLGIVCRWWGFGRATSVVGSPALAAWCLISTGLLLAGYEELRFATVHHAAFEPVLLVAFVLLGLGACGAAGSVRARRAAFIAFLVLGTAVQIAVLKHAPAPGDVGVASRESIAALLHGRDPYAITLPNPYNQTQTHLFYDPEVLLGHRLNFGYAYLPVSLIAGLPGFVIGNVTYSHVLALVALTVLLRRLAVDGTGRVLALVPMAMSFTSQILINQWVEPIPMLMLGLCAWAWAERRRRVTPIALGLLLSTKQYFFFVLPLLLVVRRGLGTRATVVAVAVAGLTCGAFVAWNPAAFWHSAVWLQFHLPLREDSVTLPVAWSRTFGAAPEWALGPAAAAAGLLVSALVARRGGDSPTTFCIGTGLGILATVLLSPHAFSNYYALIEVALVIGCITWPRDHAAPSPPSAE